MKELAPICLSVYIRVEHLKITINALKKNTLAKESELHIFSDGAKEGDEQLVQTVRDYIHTIDGFKNIYIYERRHNDRFANARKGLENLLNKYGRCITLEEDTVTAPGFLQFMNEALNTYESRDDILNISAYTPNLNASATLMQNSFIFQKFISWGLGLWKEKFYQVKPIEENNYLNFINNRTEIDYVVANCGRESVKHFEDECYSGSNHYDVQATFLEYKENMYTLYPRYALVSNIGHDGSGLHSSITDKFKVALWDKTENFMLDKDIKSDVNIKKDMSTFFTPCDKDINQSVVNAIVKKIEASNVSSFSIWGTNLLTDLVLKELKNSNIVINHIICSWAKDDTYYKKQKVITPQKALEMGEKNFIIMSFGSRFKMRDSIIEMTDEDINIIMY